MFLDGGGACAQDFYQCSPFADEDAPAGGIFDAAQPPASTDPGGYGLLTIEFADCNTALLTYQINAPAISGQFPIERIALDNVALCEVLSAP